MEKNYTTNYQTYEKAPCLKNRQGLVQLHQVVLVAIMMLLSISGLRAQTVSGNWDAANTNGTAGYADKGNGVIQLLSTGTSTCAAAAVHETSVQYDPTSGTAFSKCYQVFFGCPGNDDIGSDTKGDGMAFSFSKCSPYNINNGACGGGLGYHGGCGQMITIEFDTYSSQGNSGFDANYGGGTTGNNDELAVHFGGQALDANRLTSVNAGNLEDGLEHTVCISYTPGTRILAVTIDGVSRLSYDLGATYNLQTYFGAGGLNQTWSSGKFGATNPATVSDGVNSVSISSQLGGVPLCPADVFITSPTGGTQFNICNGPTTITATATAPAGNTVNYVEFFVDGVSIGTDNTAPYSLPWTPTTGALAITAVAHYSPSNTTTASAATNISVGIQKTTTNPVVDGTVEALWNSYSSAPLTKGYNSPPDLGATYKVIYSTTALYILVNVVDDNKVRNGAPDASWEDDGVEIFIDVGNKKMGTYQGSDFQYSFNWNTGTIIENKHSATGGVVLGQSNTANGYIMEISIPWGTLGIAAGGPAANSKMGFDVKVNDDDNGGTRDHELGWNDGSFTAWSDPSKFGTLQFTNCDPLPVSLLNFTGKLINGTAVLNWTTIVEINNLKFVVERSSDLFRWEAIGEVAGGGNVASITNYNYTDYSFPGGTVYYRLRQIDLDGKASHSNVAVVQAGGGSVNLWPNPFDDVFTIQSSIQGTLDVSIYDVLGRLVYHVSEKNTEGTLSIQPELSSGAYLVTVRTDTLVEQYKIIKK